MAWLTTIRQRLAMRVRRAFLAFARRESRFVRMGRSRAAKRRNHRPKFATDSTMIAMAPWTMAIPVVELCAARGNLGFADLGRRRAPRVPSFATRIRLPAQKSVTDWTTIAMAQSTIAPLPLAMLVTRVFPAFAPPEPKFAQMERSRAARRRNRR